MHETLLPGSRKAHGQVRILENAGKSECLGLVLGTPSRWAILGHPTAKDRLQICRQRLGEAQPHRKRCVTDSTQRASQVPVGDRKAHSRPSLPGDRQGPER